MKQSNVTGLKQLIKNSFFNSAGWTIILLVNLITTPYIVFKLTIEGYGIYALLTSLIGYYNLFDIGLGQGVIKFVAEYKAKQDYNGIYRSINAALWVQLCTGLICSVSLILFSEAIIKLLNISPAYYTDVKIGLYISAAGFFFSFLSGTFTSTLMGLQRYDITSKINVSINFLLNIFTILILYLGAGLKEVIYLNSFSAIFSFIICYIFLTKQLPLWSFSFKLDKFYFKKLFTFSGFIFISKVSNLFSNYIVRFIISFYLGPSAVTYFVVPMKLISAFGGLLSSAFNVIFPYTSELGAEKNQEKIKKTFIQASRYFTSISIPGLLTLFIFSKPILVFWMGEDFASKSWFILSALSFSSLIGSLTTVPNLITMGLGHSKVIGIFSCITTLVYLISLPLLTKLLGIPGTLTGMIIAVMPGIPLILYECKYIFYTEIRFYIINILGLHILTIFISFILLGFMTLGFNTHLTYPLLILSVIFVCVYYFILLKLDYLPVMKIINKLKGVNYGETI